jgi:hypothetical protein
VGFKRGIVDWIDITDTAQAATIVADYLIITVPEFFSPQNADLQRLADHRASYNGYDVAIVNAADIFSDAVGFYYEGNSVNPNEPDKYKLEQRLRTFIRRVFEGKNAQPGINHEHDGHMAFVLLVGDWDDDLGGIPGATEHGYNYDDPTNELYRSDYYYSCITKDTAGKYDNLGDLYIGRFSVESNEHLMNMVQKTINHETNFSDTAWRKKAGYTNIWNFSSYQLENYFNIISDIMYNWGWYYSIVDGIILNDAIKIPTINYLNAGVAYVQYLTFAGYETPDTWKDGLNISYFSNELNNDYMAPFISAVGSPTARFDNIESLGEFLTRYDSIKGSVGYIGTTRSISAVTSQTTGNFQECFLQYLFNDTISIAGELLLTAKNKDNSTSYFMPHRKHGYILLGDPALNILSEEPEEGCRMYVTNQTILLLTDTLYVPDDCILYFEPQGKLIVEEGGALVLGNRVQVIGVDNFIDTVIHIKGGGFTLGNNVTFTDLPGGILLENEHSSHDPSFFDKNITYNLRGITFINSPLMHRGTLLNISNCTFNNESNVYTTAGWSSTDSCIFNQSSFTSEDAVPKKIHNDYTRVNYNQFTGNSTHTAISILNSEWYVVSYNTISGYETGILLTKSGTTQSLISESHNPNNLIPADRIDGNTVSNCGTGLELYNSVANISGNKIRNNFYGVRIYNNSYTVFDIYLQHNQYIQNCESIELYASENSFPTVFRYNHISDTSNLGNSNDIPLFWWDVDTPYYGKKEVPYNCWGSNFNHLLHLYPVHVFDCSPAWCSVSGGGIEDGREILYRTGLTYFSEEDYPNAEATFKQLINTYPNSPFAIAAMHELFALEQFTNQDFYTLQSYYASFTSADSNLYNVADFLATRCHVEERNWQPAVDWYENRIINPPTYQDSVFAVIDLGNIHLMMENEEPGSKGASCSYRLANIKPESK